MMKKISIASAALAMLASGVIGAAPASAQYYGDQYRGGYSDGRGYDRHDGYRSYDRGYRNDRYEDRGYNYRNRNYRYNYRCRRSDGTTGTILGAIAGGLLGNSIAGRGDRTAGTVIGGAAGALAGRAIDKSDSRCYR